MCLIQLIKIKHFIDDLFVYKQLNEVLFFFSFSEVTDEAKILRISAVEEKLQLISLRDYFFFLSREAVDCI